MGTTTTPNLGLIKPDGSEPGKNFPAQQNANVDVIDALPLNKWETIFESDTVNDADVVSITSSKYKIIRGFCVGALTAEGRLTLRVNDDSTVDLHRSAWAAYRLDTGAVDNSNAGDGTMWSVAQWSTASNNTASFEIFRTHIDTVLSFEGHGFRAATGTTLRHKTLSGGDLNGSRLISSLRFGASSGSSISGDMYVLLEGYVV